MEHDPRNLGGGANKKLGETGQNEGGCMGTEFTKERKARYCQALVAARGSREVAARKIGVHRVTVMRHMKEDPEFLADVEGALEEYRNLLVSEAHRRGVEGIRKPVFFQGKRAWDVDDDGDPIPAFVEEYDSALLLALLKRWIPEFKEKQIVENRNLNVDMGLADLEELTLDQQEKLRELLETQDPNGEIE
tara:strand:+ start:648 stop:1220 length:573 start_codon:yes stop_codon:yes gene_type:complete